jgi:hypothetical protein
MRKQGGGFGFVMLLVVLVIIFFAAMRNLNSVAPAAMEIQKHNKQRKAGAEAQPEAYEPKTPSTSASADAWNPAPPARPSLSTMDERTTTHSNEVQSALSQAN